ncbi:hypothetical protein THAOC_33152 [Thalassiosira oceanica]|uniref:Uncharacterized protein n=1 Tax=Thalassiosira oceanica TaxID=159749 RepID=K0RMV9_THAOC|nr:hypothetical protein THAOC_33152 [Thalassiosira oceanica]|eukprot:EJK48077.1 hypothetical protein THAOC_33152 [Thalassiosira oceanica]
MILLHSSSWGRFSLNFLQSYQCNRHKQVSACLDVCNRAHNRVLPGHALHTETVQRMDTQQQMGDTQRMDTQRMDTQRMDTQRMDTQRMYTQRMYTQQMDTQRMDTQQLSKHQLSTQC